MDGGLCELCGLLLVGVGVVGGGRYGQRVGAGMWGVVVRAKGGVGSRVREMVGRWVSVRVRNWVWVEMGTGMA